jgi:hypothetical protein
LREAFNFAGWFGATLCAAVTAWNAPQRKATKEAKTMGRASFRFLTAASEKLRVFGSAGDATALSFAWTWANGRMAPRRLALEASNLDEAKAALERKRIERCDGKLLDDFAQE